MLRNEYSDTIAASELERPNKWWHAQEVEAAKSVKMLSRVQKTRQVDELNLYKNQRLS